MFPISAQAYTYDPDVTHQSRRTAYHLSIIHCVCGTILCLLTWSTRFATLLVGGSALGLGISGYFHLNSEEAWENSECCCQPLNASNNLYYCNLLQTIISFLSGIITAYASVGEKNVAYKWLGAISCFFVFLDFIVSCLFATPGGELRLAILHRRQERDRAEIMARISSGVIRDRSSVSVYPDMEDNYFDQAYDDEEDEDNDDDRLESGQQTNVIGVGGSGLLFSTSSHRRASANNRHRGRGRRRSQHILTSVGTNIIVLSRGSETDSDTASEDGRDEVPVTGIPIYGYPQRGGGNPLLPGGQLLPGSIPGSIGYHTQQAPERLGYSSNEEGSSTRVVENNATSDNSPQRNTLTASVVRQQEQKDMSSSSVSLEGD